LPTSEKGVMTQRHQTVVLPSLNFESSDST
jgi:hypothetical protein